MTLFTSLVAIQSAYEACRDTEGVSVEEWEKVHDLPRFSVYPQLRNVTDPNQEGFYMYPRAMHRKDCEGMRLRYVVTEHDVRRMKQLVSQGLRQCQVARLMGFAESVISKRLQKPNALERVFA